MSDAMPTVRDRAAITQWLFSGETGISSRFLAALTLGVDPDPRFTNFNWPHDPADFRRCHLLVERCPAVPRLGLHRAAASHEVWARLVGNWSELVALLDEEIPGWREEATGRAPRTYARMKELGA